MALVPTIVKTSFAWRSAAALECPGSLADLARRLLLRGGFLATGAGKRVKPGRFRFAGLATWLIPLCDGVLQRLAWPVYYAQQSAVVDCRDARKLTGGYFDNISAGVAGLLCSLLLARWFDPVERHRFHARIRTGGRYRLQPDVCRDPLILG